MVALTLVDGKPSAVQHVDIGRGGRPFLPRYSLAVGNCAIFGGRLMIITALTKLPSIQGYLDGAWLPARSPALDRPGLPTSRSLSFPSEPLFGVTRGGRTA